VLSLPHLRVLGVTANPLPAPLLAAAAAGFAPLLLHLRRLHMAARLTGEQPSSQLQLVVRGTADSG
jgi:hypothetical protein